MINMINLVEIKKTAKLAKFNITGEEAALYSKQMSAVLDWVAQLQSVDTSAPQASAEYSASAPLREDTPHVCSCAEDIVSAFNDKDGGNLRVKKVL